MREILFRAKRVDNGEWVEGYYTKLKWCNNIIYVVIPDEAEIDSGNSLCETYEINPETLCQYTGLTDKNGKRIWENDIVKIGANTLVRWNEKYAGWCLVQRGWMYEHFFGEAIDERDCEVVGNIIDNPELMEKQTDIYRINEGRTDMQELEKILEEIEMKKKKCLDIVRVEIDPMEITIHREQYKGLRMAEDIIRKHMNDGWIPVEQELPPNSKHKGALCPRYQVMTKYGVTEGWYNPDYESWYILCWFMGNDHLKHEIDFERGTFPKVVRCENSVNDKHGIVIAWRPLPEPYHPERSNNHDRAGSD